MTLNTLRNTIQQHSGLLELLATIIIGLLMILALAGCGHFPDQVYRDTPPMIEPTSSPDEAPAGQPGQPFAASRFS